MGESGGGVSTIKISQREEEENLGSSGGAWNKGGAWVR